jgi:uncharacterized protein DUF5320
MPGGDGTGPGGMGPMTGRAAGFCAGYPVAGCANAVGGRGYGGWGRGGGFGRGRGFGWGRGGYGLPAGTGYATPYAGYPSGFGTAPSPEQEKDALKQQAQYLQQSLESIGKRIEELEKERG